MIQSLMTIRYLVADPTSDRRYEVGADRFGFEIPGSALDAEHLVMARARELLTVQTYGQRGPKSRLGVDHRLVPA